MPVEHLIAMDTHSYTTEICVKTRPNTPGRIWRVPTTIPALREAIGSVRRPRVVAFEEGPLAAWLARNLRADADRLIVCDPRKNAYIAKGSDKDDAIDANKLADLLGGGYLKPVHHSDDVSREAFKQLVGLYHERVAHRVSEANKVIGRLRRWGIVVREKAFADEADRPALLAKLPAEAPSVLMGVELMLEGYDQAVKQETKLKRQLVKEARTYEPVVRFTDLPGVAWVRAATAYAYLDTPWRFRSKQALWKYMGIGLKRESSGNGPEYLSVELASNRVLKSAILGAAESAIMQKDNPFARQHQHWKEQGISPRNARRNVARSMAAVMWGMWKNGGSYDPLRVGVAACEQTQSCDGRPVDDDGRRTEGGKPPSDGNRTQCDGHRSDR
jgi:transposase